MAHAMPDGIEPPWAHQLDAVGEIKALFGADGRKGPDACVVTMACGTGKTRVAAMLMNHYRHVFGKHCVLFAPQQNLAQQLVDRMSVRWNLENVKLVMQANDWDRAWDSAPALIVCVYASAEKLNHLDLGLVVYDEAHHLVASQDSDDSWASHVKGLRSKKAVYMTATSNDMLDELEDVPEVFRFDIGKGVGDGITLDYVILYGDSRTQESVVNETMSFLGGRRTGRPVLAAQKVISISSTKAEADKLLLATRGFGYKAAFHSGSPINPSTPGALQDRLKLFEAPGSAYLGAVLMGTEGTDMPNIDAVVVNTKGDGITPVRVVQALGRTLRKGGISERGVMRVSRRKLKSVIQALIGYDTRLRVADNARALAFVREHFVKCDAGPDLSTEILRMIRAAARDVPVRPNSTPKTPRIVPIPAVGPGLPAVVPVAPPVPPVRPPVVPVVPAVVPVAPPVVPVVAPPVPLARPPVEPIQPHTDSSTAEAVAPLPVAPLPLPPSPAVPLPGNGLPNISELLRDVERADRASSMERGVLYCIEECNDDGTSTRFFKVGRTSDMDSRLVNLQTGNPRKLRKFDTIAVTQDLAMVETTLLRLLKTDVGTYKARGAVGAGTEWFQLRHGNLREVRKLMHLAMFLVRRDQGHTD